MQKIFFTFLVVFLGLLTSCNSLKSPAVQKQKTTTNSAIFFTKYKNKIFRFETLNARLKVSYKSGKSGLNPSASLRMKYNEKIWISVKFLGITAAKVLITPEKVQYYEKLNSTYFQGDFRSISKWLGTPLDFQKIQRLLIGQTIENLNETAYDFQLQDSLYVLNPKEHKTASNQHLFKLDPANFKVLLQQFLEPNQQRALKVSYGPYQEVKGQLFPQKISINAQTPDKQTVIEVDYKSVEHNTLVSFPFQIPQGFKRVTIP